MPSSKLLNSSLNLVEESEAEMSQRYTGFGSRIFNELFKELPKLSQAFKFYRNTDGTEDVWAIHNSDNIEFGIQLDPNIEVICIWDDSYCEEIGCWVSDPIGHAINVITQRYPVR